MSACTFTSTSCCGYPTTGVMGLGNCTGGPGARITWRVRYDAYLNNRDIWACPSAPTLGATGYSSNRRLLPSMLGVASLARLCPDKLMYGDGLGSAGFAQTAYAGCQGFGNGHAANRHSLGANFVFVDGHGMWYRTGVPAPGNLYPPFDATYYPANSVNLWW